MTAPTTVSALCSSVRKFLATDSAPDGPCLYEYHFKLDDLVGGLELDLPFPDAYAVGTRYTFTLARAMP